MDRDSRNISSRGFDLLPPRFAVNGPDHRTTSGGTQNPPPRVLKRNGKTFVESYSQRITRDGKTYVLPSPETITKDGFIYELKAPETLVQDGKTYVLHRPETITD